MISFADIEVQPFSTPAHGDGYETIEKQVPYAAPLPASSYCEQKQLRFVGHDSGKRESDNVLPLPRQAQPHPRHRHQSGARSEEHTSELQSLMRISYAVFCLKKKNNTTS